MKRSNKAALIFVIAMMAYPVIQWLIFYVYGNLNSVLLSFQEFDIDTRSFRFLPWNRMFENFGNFFKDLFKGENLGSYFLNGVIMHLACTVISWPIGLVFSYLLYKKAPLSKLYKVLLFLPTILSAMVMAMFFKYFVERALPSWFESNTLYLMDAKWSLFTVIAYSVFMSMPGSIVINVSTMSRVPPDLVEYGRLEGISMFKEFRHLILPLIYPLLEIQLLGVFVGFFTTSGPLFAIYAENAPEEAKTFGYYMFTQVVGRNASEAMYGYTAAANLVIGLVSVPIVYGTKFLLDKFDPQAEF